MILTFELTMPNIGSWNGKWSGADNRYLMFKTFSKKEGERLMKNDKIRNFYHYFGDGWGANITMKPITSLEKRKIEKVNKGFMGYEWMVEWMVESIIKNDKIIT